MPLSEEDLRIKMQIDLEAQGFQAGMQKVGEAADAEIAKAKKGFAALGEVGRKQMESIAVNQRFTAGFAAPTPTVQIDAQAEAIKLVNAELDKQRETLVKIQALNNPKLLRERVALEKQISDAKKSYATAFSAEQIQQGGIGSIAKQIGLGALGGFTGGGAGGGIGGAVGGGIGGGLLAGIGALGLASGPIGAIAAGIGAVAVALGALYETMTQTVKAAAPGVFTAFEYALKDTIAVVGKTLIPFMRLWTDELRLFGDVLANILPNTKEMEQALAPLREAFSNFAESIRGALIDLGPAFRDLISGLVWAVGEVAKAASYIPTPRKVETFILQHIAGVDAELAKKVVDAIHGTGGGEFRTGSGSYAHPASIESLAGYEQRLQISAFSSGVQDPIKANTEAIKENTAALKTGMYEHPGTSDLMGAAKKLRGMNDYSNGAIIAPQTFPGQGRGQ